MRLPALSAVRWNENFKNIYARLISKHGIKMKALVAPILPNLKNNSAIP